MCNEEEKEEGKSSHDVFCEILVLRIRNNFQFNDDQYNGKDFGFTWFNLM